MSDNEGVDFGQWMTIQGFIWDKGWQIKDLILDSEWVRVGHNVMELLYSGAAISWPSEVLALEVIQIFVAFNDFAFVVLFCALLKSWLSKSFKYVIAF